MPTPHRRTVALRLRPAPPVPPPPPPAPPRGRSAPCRRPSSGTRFARAVLAAGLAGACLAGAGIASAVAGSPAGLARPAGPNGPAATPALGLVAAASRPPCSGDRPAATPRPTPIRPHTTVDRGPTVLTIDPTTTDPAIEDVDLPNAEGFLRHHLVALDPAAPSTGRLFLWLPGTGGAPTQYQAITRLAARLGYHAVGLVYDSWPSINAITTQVPDPELPERLRRERIFGESRTPIIEVDRANGIRHRLIRLLQHLDAGRPAEGWDTFLTADEDVDWSRVVVGGHSQGAGHAAYLTRRVALAGAMMLAGPGDFVAGSGPAPWLFEPAATPPARMFGLVHADDPPAAGIILTQTILGLAGEGPVQNVDGLPVSALSSHMLWSDVDPGHDNPHSAVAADEWLPLDEAGRPVYLAAWTFMLRELARGAETDAGS